MTFETSDFGPLIPPAGETSRSPEGLDVFAHNVEYMDGIRDCVSCGSIAWGPCKRCHRVLCVTCGRGLPCINKIKFVTHAFFNAVMLLPRVRYHAARHRAHLQTLSILVHGDPEWKPPDGGSEAWAGGCPCHPVAGEMS